MIATKNVLKVVSILLLLLLLLYFITSRHQNLMYIYYDTDENTSDDFEVIHTNAKSYNNTIPNSVDAMPEYIQPITPESEVLFPYPNITYLPHEILNSPWATELKAKLQAAKVGKQLTYVTVNEDFFSVLINWLSYAKLNAIHLLENLVVVCMDEPSDKILSQKGILSQFVPVTDIVYSVEELDKEKMYSAQVITRFTVLRILNHWGYDVLQMDIDATLITNIEPILDDLRDSDIIVSKTSAKGCPPQAARKSWKFCPCMGLILIRSNVNTERMWQALGRSKVEIAACDQSRFSSVLLDFNITWTPFDYDTNHDYLKATSQIEDLTVIALPQDVMCRNQCDAARLSSYYVWHPWSTHRGTGKQKVMASQTVWRIGDNWDTTLETVQSTMDWLDEVTI